jgi:hypothetical protein
MFLVELCDIFEQGSIDHLQMTVGHVGAVYILPAHVSQIGVELVSVLKRIVFTDEVLLMIISGYKMGFDGI